MMRDASSALFCQSYGPTGRSSVALLPSGTVDLWAAGLETLNFRNDLRHALAVRAAQVPLHD